MSRYLEELLQGLKQNRKVSDAYNKFVQTEDIGLAETIEVVDKLLELDHELFYIVDEIIKEVE